jgi:hypothetical protein
VINQLALTIPEVLFIGAMILGIFIYFNIFIDYLWSSSHLKLLKTSEDYNLRPYAFSGGMVCVFSVCLLLLESDSKAFSIITILLLTSILWARYNYFLSMRKYLKLGHRLDGIYRIFCLIISFIACVYLFQALNNGMSSIYDLSKPENSMSVLRNNMVPFKLHQHVVFIFSLNYLYCTAAFIFLMWKSFKQGEYYLCFGVFFTLFGVLFSNSYHFLNLSFWFPLSIIADVFELTRLNYVQKRVIGSRILEKVKLLDGLEGRVKEINLEHAVFKHDLVNKFMSSAMFMERVQRTMRKSDQTPNAELEGLIAKAISAQKMATALFRNNSTKKKLDLGTIIHQVSELLQVHIRLAPLVEGNTEIYFPMADLNNILVNLVKNSKEATLYQMNRWVEIDFQDDGEFYHFSVTDSGLYKNIKRPEFIFVAGNSSKDSADSGLGLFSVKSIVEKYQGEIELQANGKNTCIKFSLKKA